MKVTYSYRISCIWSSAFTTNPPHLVTFKGWDNFSTCIRNNITYLYAVDKAKIIIS